MSAKKIRHWGVQLLAAALFCGLLVAGPPPAAAETPNEHEIWITEGASDGYLAQPDGDWQWLDDDCRGELEAIGLEPIVKDWGDESQPGTIAHLRANGERVVEPCNDLLDRLRPAENPPNPEPGANWGGYEIWITEGAADGYLKQPDRDWQWLSDECRPQLETIGMHPIVKDWGDESQPGTIAHLRANGERVVEPCAQLVDKVKAASEPPGIPPTPEPTDPGEGPPPSNPGQSFPNLVENGDFSNELAGWTPSREGTATVRHGVGPADPGNPSIDGSPAVVIADFRLTPVLSKSVPVAGGSKYRASTQALDRSMGDSGPLIALTFFKADEELSSVRSEPVDGEMDEILELSVGATAPEAADRVVIELASDRQGVFVFDNVQLERVSSGRPGNPRSGPASDNPFAVHSLPVEVEAAAAVGRVTFGREMRDGQPQFPTRMYFQSATAHRTNVTIRQLDKDGLEVTEPETRRFNSFEAFTIPAPSSASGTRQIEVLADGYLVGNGTVEYRDSNNQMSLVATEGYGRTLFVPYTAPENGIHTQLTISVEENLIGQTVRCYSVETGLAIPELIDQTETDIEIDAGGTAFYIHEDTSLMGRQGLICNTVDPLGPGIRGTIKVGSIDRHTYVLGVPYDFYTLHQKLEEAKIAFKTARDQLLDTENRLNHHRNSVFPALTGTQREAFVVQFERQANTPGVYETYDAARLHLLDVLRRVPNDEVLNVLVPVPTFNSYLDGLGLLASTRSAETVAPALRYYTATNVTIGGTVGLYDDGAWIHNRLREIIGQASLTYTPTGNSRDNYEAFLGETLRILGSDHLDVANDSGMRALGGYLESADMRKLVQKALQDIENTGTRPLEELNRSSITGFLSGGSSVDTGLLPQELNSVRVLKAAALASAVWSMLGFAGDAAEVWNPETGALATTIEAMADTMSHTSYLLAALSGTYDLVIAFRQSGQPNLLGELSGSAARYVAPLSVLAAAVGIAADAADYTYHVSQGTETGEDQLAILTQGIYTVGVIYAATAATVTGAWVAFGVVTLASIIRGQLKYLADAARLQNVLRPELLAVLNSSSVGVTDADKQCALLATDYQGRYATAERRGAAIGVLSGEHIPEGYDWAERTRGLAPELVLKLGAGLCTNSSDLDNAQSPVMSEVGHALVVAALLTWRMQALPDHQDWEVVDSLLRLGPEVTNRGLDQLDNFINWEHNDHADAVTKLCQGPLLSDGAAVVAAFGLGCPVVDTDPPVAIINGDTRHAADRRDGEGQLVARVTFDGSESYDLVRISRWEWKVGDNVMVVVEPTDENPVVESFTTDLTVGEHRVCLVLSDGPHLGQACKTVTVTAPGFEHGIVLSGSGLSVPVGPYSGTHDLTLRATKLDGGEPHIPLTLRAATNLGGSDSYRWSWSLDQGGTTNSPGNGESMVFKLPFGTHRVELRQALGSQSATTVLNITVANTAPEALVRHADLDFDGVNDPISRGVKELDVRAVANHLDSSGRLVSKVWLSDGGSHDPDQWDEIVSRVWRVEGEEIAQGSTLKRSFGAGGYRLEYVVTDSKGAESVATVSLNVVEPRPEIPTRPDDVNFELKTFSYGSGESRNYWITWPAANDLATGWQVRFLALEDIRMADSPEEYIGRPAFLSPVGGTGNIPTGPGRIGFNVPELADGPVCAQVRAINTVGDEPLVSRWSGIPRQRPEPEPGSTDEPYFTCFNIDGVVPFEIRAVGGS